MKMKINKILRKEIKKENIKQRLRHIKKHIPNLACGAVFFLNTSLFQIPTITNPINQPQSYSSYQYQKPVPEPASESVSQPVPKPEVLKILNALNLKEGEYIFVINKKTQTAQLYKRDYVLVDEKKVSTGRNPGEKQRSGDNKTPAGVFEVTFVYDSSKWRHNGELAYGPNAARLNCGSWGLDGSHNPEGISPILMHGTHQPWLLGELASKGCVRLENKVMKAYVDNDYVRKGTAVAIINDNNHVPSTIEVAYVPRPMSSLEYEIECTVTSIRLAPEFEKNLRKQTGGE